MLNNKITKKNNYKITKKKKKKLESTRVNMLNLDHKAVITQCWKIKLKKKQLEKNKKNLSQPELTC
jgi:hypothetical protein